MSNVEEIEHAVEQLPLKDFAKLAAWFDQRRRQLQILQSATDKAAVLSNAYPAHDASDESRMVIRDHSAFLNSYAPQDEGLYDDAATR